MTKKEKLEVNILEAIEQVCVITCSKCQKVDKSYGADSYDIVDGLVEEGWYATEKGVWCPECNKKRLKPKVSKYSH